MADATTAPASGTSTTPTTPVAPASSTPAVAASATDAPSPTTPTSAASTPTSESTPAPAAPQEVAPTAAEPPASLFTLPKDVKLAPEALTKFDTFLRTKLNAEGKVTLTSQEVLDQFLEQAKDANVRWSKQMEQTDQTNAAECKTRFTPAQLSKAEAAVGFASSLDPAFLEFAKRQLNDPVFVNFMRAIGERLSEDDLEIGTLPSAPARKGPMTRKEAGQALYGKSLKTN